MGILDRLLISVVRTVSLGCVNGSSIMPVPDFYSPIPSWTLATSRCASPRNGTPSADSPKSNNLTPCQNLGIAMLSMSAGTDLFIASALCCYFYQSRSGLRRCVTSRCCRGT